MANNGNLPQSRQIARDLGEPHYYTGRPCKRGHIDVRRTSTAACLACRREDARDWADLNRDKKSEKARGRYWENPELHREKCRKNYMKNKKRYRSYAAAKEAAKMKRTPIWANREAIRLIYEKAYSLTKETGIDYEVDHIFPLQGKTVSGLHVESNLQVITAYENRSKHNKHPDELETIS